MEKTMPCPHHGLLPLVVAVVLAAGALLFMSPGQVLAVEEDCGVCHAAKADVMQESAHAGLSCLSCHPDAEDHPIPYQMPSAAGYFQMEVCGTCHPDQYATYTYDDGAATKYGGSPQAEPKQDAFPFYSTIIDGHGFVREYNEERTHKYMMQDHAEIKRGKFEVCLQCKSTRVTYYWGTGRTAVLQQSHEVEWAPTGEVFTVPAGTTVNLSTDVTGEKTGTKYQVMAEVLWDGTLYTTYDKPGAVQDQKRTWLAAYAMSVDGLPEGSPSITDTATCNHCHDPHATEFRLIRKELARVVGEKGVNPYEDEKRSFEAAGQAQKVNTVCAQCHVEYVCGKSGVDGINRDYFPWAKAADLEALYEQVFPYTDDLGLAAYSQDWVHGKGVRPTDWPPADDPAYPVNLPLVKNQHPETETFWDSTHDRAGLSCADCHLPRVSKNGKTFTSHWFASPLKYMDPTSAGALADSLGLTVNAEGVINPCVPCHSGTAAQLSAQIVGLQDEIYAQAGVVEKLLVESLQAISEARGDEEADLQPLQWAVDRHRAAHVRWENLAVSENSMGRHNHGEVMRELRNSERWARMGRREALMARGPISEWVPVDVPAGHLYREDIVFLGSRGIVSGFENGAFVSDGTLLRAQVAKMLTLALGMHDDELDTDDEPRFVDVPYEGQTYPFDFVQEAAQWGVVQGYAGQKSGTFGPYDTLSRIQLVRMVARALTNELEQPPAGYAAGFTDVAAEDAASVALLEYNQVVDGRAATRFDPYAPVTRGQTAKVLHRVMEAVLTP